MVAIFCYCCHLISSKLLIIIFSQKTLSGTLSESETVWSPIRTNILSVLILSDLILYVPSTIFQLYRDGSSCQTLYHLLVYNKT